MKKRLTKKLIQELQTLSDTYGYWSKEVYEFNCKLHAQMNYDKVKELNLIIKNNQPKP